MTPEWAEKIVLVTGAGKGIGRALAQAFATGGAAVIANDLTPINLDQTISQIQAAGGQAHPYIADISSKLALQTMLNTVLDEHGRIDYLIHTLSASPSDDLLDMDEWAWRRTLEINLTGPFLLTQSVGRIMKAQGGGRIIHLVAGDNERAIALAGKSGLVGLIRAVGSEFKAYNIQINAVCSGLPEAEQIANLPDNAIDLVLSLCHEKSQGINGRIILVRPYDS